MSESGVRVDFNAQAEQFPPRGPAGLEHVVVMDGRIDAWLYRTGDGSEVVGILYYYRVDLPPWQKAGDVVMMTREDWRGRGVATAMAQAVLAAYPDLDTDGQRYTPDGRAAYEAFLVRYPRAITAATAARTS